MKIFNQFGLLQYGQHILCTQIIIINLLKLLERLPVRYYLPRRHPFAIPCLEYLLQRSIMTQYLLQIIMQRTCRPESATERRRIRPLLRHYFPLRILSGFFGVNHVLHRWRPFFKLHCIFHFLKVFKDGNFVTEIGCDYLGGSVAEGFRDEVAEFLLLGDFVEGQLRIGG